MTAFAMGNSGQIEIAVQYADSPTDRDLEYSTATFDDFRKQFRSFDWQNQINRDFWLENAQPGIFVRDCRHISQLFVSAVDMLSHALDYREPTNSGWLEFLVLIQNRQEMTKAESIPPLADLAGAAFSTGRRTLIEEAICCYFDADYKTLRTLLQSFLKVTIRSH